MKILITNSRLDARGGSESFVRDLGRGLEKLGHSVVAYSSIPGQRQRLLERGMVSTADAMEHLGFLPDVIHAQHHLDAMTAITALPGVPALYHCHGAVWRECPPKHPRIYRYLAMSRTLAERMMAESNIAPSEITVFLNGADLSRFSIVRSLPASPVRALIYHKIHEDDNPTVSAIRAAAARCGIELDFLGRRFGKMTDHPENILPNYDIVFASGLSAIEAMACGCAVVILGRTSCGEMVRPENFDRFRQVNFSIAVNSPPPSADRIEAEIRRFRAGDCVQVTERLRREADFGASVTKLVGIYEAVIERHRTSNPDWRAESLATSRYLRKIVPLIRMTDDAFEEGGPSKAAAESSGKPGAPLEPMEEETEADLRTVDPKT
jgi:hypothetical protein